MLKFLQILYCTFKADIPDSLILYTDTHTIDIFAIDTVYMYVYSDSFYLL